ncbi:MAG: hypothetical protein ACK47B_18005 [Armatimonadota bacterium]
MGSLLSRGRYQEFTRYLERVLMHPRVSSAFFSSRHGMTVVLLMVHRWEALGLDWVRSVLTALEPSVGALGASGIRLYRLRLDELSGAPVDRDLKDRYRSDFARQVEREIGIDDGRRSEVERKSLVENPFSRLSDPASPTD